MRPSNLKTKIFLDGGSSFETKKAKEILGFLDGQTTNPTLIAKNPEVQKWLKQGKKFSEKEIWDFYKKTAEEISEIIPESSVSLEVYASKDTEAREMISQAKEIYKWIKNARIKLPITKEGLKAAQHIIKEGMNINMTLCFSQEQAAAVYRATLGAEKGQVFISPFVGRLDDIGENGMDLIKNIIEMYKKGDGHVEILTASVRNLNHLLCAINFGSDIITCPLIIINEWVKKGMPLPNEKFVFANEGLMLVPYKEIDLWQDLEKFNISHDLTEKGLKKFASDWNTLII